MNPLAADLDHILAHTGDIWESLRGESIFVTGGTGFFGRWLLESFAHANEAHGLDARMVVLSRNPARFEQDAPHLSEAAGIRFVTGDVQTFTAENVASQLAPPAPELYRFVIHAATEASARLNVENPLLMIDTIVRGTRAALEFAVAARAERFLLTSSGAVYGTQPSQMTHVAETYLGGPNCTSGASAYAEAKRVAELLCVAFRQQHRIDPLLARCFAFVGPFLPLDAHFAIGNFIRDALRGEPIRVRGDGSPRRSYLYAADLMIWLWTILVRGTPMRPYNVGSADDFSIAEIAEAVRRVVAPSVDIVIAAPAPPGAQASRYVPDTTRSRNELDLKEHVQLEEAIRRTAAVAKLRQPAGHA